MLLKKPMRGAFFAILIWFLLCGSTAAAVPARIVSLAPSLTEILYDLGLGDRVAAVTIYCNHPPRAKMKPKIGGMTDPSLEKIVGLHPDLVVMTEDGNPAGLDERLKKLGIRTLRFRTVRLEGLPAAIRTMGTALGVSGTAAKRAERIEKALCRMKERALSRAGREARKALFIVQPDPLLAAGSGTAIDDGLKLLGVENIASDAGNGYPPYSLERVVARAPDVILIGRGPGMSNEYASGLLKKLGMLDAVKKGRVCYVNDPMFRLGPRIVEGLREMEQCLERTR